MISFVWSLITTFYFNAQDRKLDCASKYARDRINIVTSGIIKKFQGFVDQFNKLTDYVHKFNKKINAIMYEYWSFIEFYDHIISSCDIDGITKNMWYLVDMFDDIDHYLVKLDKINDELVECDRIINDQYDVFRLYCIKSTFESIVMNNVVNYYGATIKPLTKYIIIVNDIKRRLIHLRENVSFLINKTGKIMV